MPSEHDSKDRVRRKLTKRRKPKRYPSVQYPERLQEGEDAQEDVTAAKGQPAQYVNQSVFSMIAAAGSKTDFHSRFDDESSDSGDEPQATPAGVQKHGSLNSLLERSLDQHQVDVDKSAPNRHDRRPHEQGLLKSLPRLNLRIVEGEDSASRTGLGGPSARRRSTGSPKRATPRDAPIMSRMLEAEAELDKSTEHTGSTAEGSQNPDVTGIESGRSSLAKRLKEIFSFVAEEEVISGRLRIVTVLQQPTDTIIEYPCWLLQSVLLQGYMYITQNHICFYAYLPKKSVSYHPLTHMSHTHEFLECGLKVWPSRQERQTESQIQSLLVHSQGRCALILC